MLVSERPFSGSDDLPGKFLIGKFGEDDIRLRLSWLHAS